MRLAYSPSLNLRLAYSCFSSWTVAFFVQSDPTHIAAMASHASLAVFFAPNDSVYSVGTAARITSIADMSTFSLSAPLSMAF